MAFDPTLVTDKSHFDPITVHDKQFYAFKQIELSTAGMMIRELVKNAMEAAMAAPPGQREIVIDQVIYYEVPKLRIWNTGHAMDAEALYHMGNLACDSEKAHGLDQNFGEGAKVAALRNNALGMIYTSCKDGIVSLIWLARSENSYGRLSFRNDPRITMAGNSVLDVTEDYTGAQRSRDWTQVVLLGKTEQQNTVIDPYGNGEASKTWLAHELYQRFFHIDPTISISLSIGHNYTNTKTPVRYFRTMEDRLDLGHFTDFETVHVDGIKIHFIHDKPYNTNRESDKHVPLQSSIPFGGIVYKDEFYSVLTVNKNHNHWTDNAPKLGISFGARNISVFVELPDDYPAVPETNRRNLLNDDRTPMVLQDQFADLVYDHRPQWIKDLVVAYGPPAEASIDDVQKRLREFMKKLNLKDEAKIVTEDGDTQTDTQDDIEIIRLSYAHGGGAGGGGSTREPDRGSGSGRAARNVMVDLPMFSLIPLFDEQEIREKGIVGKAAKFVRTRTGTMFINMKYPAIDALIETLAPSFAHITQDEILGRMTKLVQEEMLFRVCATAARALAKQRNVDWTRPDVDKALEPECFSIAADGIDDDLGKIKQRLVMEFPVRASA